MIHGSRSSVAVGDGFYALRWMRVRWRGRRDERRYPFGLHDWQGIACLCGCVRAGRVVVDAGQPFAGGPSALACYIDPAPSTSTRGPGGLHMKSDTRAVPMTPDEFFRRFARRRRNAAIVEKAAARVVVPDEAALEEEPPEEAADVDRSEPRAPSSPARRVGTAASFRNLDD